MIPPCPKCGATKTDPVPHNFKYNLARALGYRLQKCSRCRKSRYLPRHSKKPDGSSQPGKLSTSEPPSVGNQVKFASGKAKAGPEGGAAPATDFASREKFRCPACGSKGYHRTKRTIQERMMGRGPMARCEICGLRFAHPGYTQRRLEPAGPVGAAPVGSQFAEERQLPEMPIENSHEHQESAHTQISSKEPPKCPSCGSSKYHRTERTALERALQRPAMARCERCGKRFPYVKHPDEPSASAPAGNTTHPGVAEANATDSSPHRETGRCPFCGATSYRRSHRSVVERLLFRPKMARCSHCRKRFPFPES